MLWKFLFAVQVVLDPKMFTSENICQNCNSADSHEIATIQERLQDKESVQITTENNDISKEIYLWKIGVACEGCIYQHKGMTNDFPDSVPNI